MEEQRYRYSIYLLQHRALPALTDGIKTAARRVLWTAKDGKKYKSASLAGLCMSLHPHAAPESTINTLAAPYGNNIPLLHGLGAFGTLLNPTGYGASRYTSVKISQFTKDVVFKDIHLVPLQDNYDNTIKEPKHFLPLIPLVLLNGTEGIAVGFSCNILPRKLSDIIEAQITFLKSGKVKNALPSFGPTNSQAIEFNEKEKWVFHGTFEKKNSAIITITGLPHGILHEKYLSQLNKLMNDGIIIDYVVNSSDKIRIDVIFQRGIINTLSDDEILKNLSLVNEIAEHINIIDINHTSVLASNFVQIIEEFTAWRLEWYVARYSRLISLLELEIQRYKDILLAINKNIGSKARSVQSRSSLKKLLSEIGIVNVDYIVDLQLYRFTEAEKEKIANKLKDAKVTLKEYQKLLSSERARKMVYIAELEELLLTDFTA